jgi:hypothetical protein
MTREELSYGDHAGREESQSLEWLLFGEDR